MGAGAFVTYGMDGSVYPGRLPRHADDGQAPGGAVDQAQTSTVNPED